MRTAVLGLGLALLVLGVTASAQTTYTQSQPVLCRVATLICNPQLQGGGSYETVCGYNTFTSGCSAFYFDGVSGEVTEVVTDFPKLGGSGAFSFKFSLSDGRTGSVSGQGHWVRMGRWWYAEFDSSTLTVN